MTAYAIKLIAVFTMLIDHAAYILWLCGRLGGTGYVFLRSIGRISFVLFAFLLVNGMEKTSNPHRYFSRLLLFALISQVPFSLAFSSENYMAGAVAAGLSVSFHPAWVMLLLSCGIWLVYFGGSCRWKADWSLLALAVALVLPLMHVTAGGYTLLGSELSIFYTLAISMALCLCADGLYKALTARRGILRALLPFAAAVAAVIFIQPVADYGFFGLALIVALYIARKSCWAQVAVIMLWCIAEYYFKLHSLVYALYAMLAIFPVLMYKGERGRKMGIGFYLVYPVHLCIFSLIGFALSR